MRAPFNVMFRWWKESNGNGHGGEATAAAEANDETKALGPEPPEQEQPEVEAPYLAQLDREGIPRSLRYPSTTLARMLDQTADRFGDNLTLVYNHKSRWKYRELVSHVNR